MNEKSITASRHGRLSIRAVPVIIASPSPVETSASARRSVYGLRSKNPSGSLERNEVSSSANCRRRTAARCARALLHREVMAALRTDPQQRLQLVVAVVRATAGTGVGVLLRRPVVERGLLVLDRDVDLVGGGHLRHLRPGSATDGYRPAAAASRATSPASASPRNPVSPSPASELASRRSSRSIASASARSAHRAPA